jgi:hypothetical protein
LNSIFPSPLIPGEDAQAYEAFLAQVTTSVKPADATEELWVRDIVDLTWELQRWRRMKASLLAAAKKGALERLLGFTEGPCVAMLEDPFWRQELASQWLVNEENAVAEVEAILNARGLDIHSIMAQALSDNLKQIERLDRMAASAEARRDKVFMNIERRRESLARRLRMATDTIIDVD